MKIQLTPHFRHTYKKLVKRNASVQSTFNERMRIFSKNPNDVRLKNHALSGTLSGARGVALAYDLRALFYIEKDTYIFFDIGTHDDVY